MPILQWANVKVDVELDGLMFSNFLKSVQTPRYGSGEKSSVIGLLTPIGMVRLRWAGVVKHSEY